MTEIKTVPRLESFKRALSFVENPLPVIDAALKTYGNTYYTRIIGGRKIVMTIEPVVAQHILQKNNKNYIKSELQTEALGKYVGLGLLTANGDYWLRQRRLIQPGFHKAKLATLIEIMVAEIEKFYDDLELRIGQNTSVDINDAMMELTLRVVSKSLFSTGIDEDKIVELGNTINRLQQHIVREVRLPLMNWWRRVNGSVRRAKSLAAEVRGMLQVIIDQRKADGVVQDDLLDMLIHSRYEDTGEPMTNQQILDEAIILFVAGYETTANTLAWCLHSLREHP
ncbi:MAG: cytochrome P450, partial [Saprospiraceae bacterium]|nr:cytochrome P450 [Saprospiraceae bacterium]